MVDKGKTSILLSVTGNDKKYQDRKGLMEEVTFTHAFWVISAASFLRGKSKPTFWLLREPAAFLAEAWGKDL